MQLRRHIGLALVLAMGSATALANTYPSKPIKLVVPFAPGGTTDIIARVIAEPMGKALGQTVVVENKGGGGGAIGALETARSAPDGYSLGIATVSSAATNPAINPKIPYNTLTDFTPVINIAATPNVLAVNPKFGPTDYKSFEAKVKSTPDLAFASSGTGGIQHMLMEVYKSVTGTQMTHVPYRGAGPALNDLVAGQVPMMLDNLPSALGFIKEKRLLAIAVAAPERLAVLPDVPTFKEVGVEQVNRMAFYGILGPKGMPPEIVAKLNDAVRQALADPAVKKRIEDTGSLVIGNSPAEFAQQIKEEYELYRNVVQTQKLTLEQ